MMLMLDNSLGLMIAAVWSAKDGTYAPPPAFVLNVDVGPILPGVARTTTGDEVVSGKSA